MSVACAERGSRGGAGALPVRRVVAGVLVRAVVRRGVQTLELRHQLVDNVGRLLLIGDRRADRVLEHLPNGGQRDSTPQCMY